MSAKYPPLRTRWRCSFRNSESQRRRKSMPQTEVDNDVFTAMYAIARNNGVSLYDVCRRAYREFIDANPDLIGVEETPVKDGEEWKP